MTRKVKIKWQEIYYPSRSLKYEGFTKIDSRVNMKGDRHISYIGT